MPQRLRRQLRPETEAETRDARVRQQRLRRPPHLAVEAAEGHCVARVEHVAEPETDTALLVVTDG